MKFKRHIRGEFNLQPIDVIPFVNVVFLLLIFFILSSFFTYPTGIKIKLPRAVTSESIKEGTLTIVLTSEGVIYLNSAIVTVKDLRKELSKSSAQNRPVLIKADRRASLGRIIDIWNMCRELNIEKVNLATDQER